MRRTRPASIAPLAATAVLLAGAWPAAGQQASLEYAVKANFLYKFAPFVEWPPNAFSTATSPFVVCILGADPFGSALDQAVRGQKIDERPVAVRRIERADHGVGCHVLYLGRPMQQTPAEALKAIEGDPMLTVTDQNVGAVRGAIHFVLRAGRVRFEIDTERAAANRVVISSKLLSLAVPRAAS